MTLPTKILAVVSILLALIVIILALIVGVLGNLAYGFIKSWRR